MQIWRYLRIITFSLVLVSPILLQTGCGGDGDGDDAANELPLEDDPTLNPETDSTMNPNADPTMKEGEAEKE